MLLLAPPSNPAGKTCEGSAGNFAPMLGPWQARKLRLRKKSGTRFFFLSRPKGRICRKLRNSVGGVPLGVHSFISPSSWHRNELYSVHSYIRSPEFLAKMALRHPGFWNRLTSLCYPLYYAVRLCCSLVSKPVSSGPQVSSRPPM